MSDSHRVTLATEGLGIRFGGHQAVQDVTASFRAGELTAIVGPNGAGKTTYFNLISGQLAATSGSVRLHGQNVTSFSAARRTRLGIGRAFQLTNLFPQLSVQENIRLAVQSRAGVGMRMFSVWSEQKQVNQRTAQILEQVAMGPLREQIAATLSHGNQRKLEVAMLLALDPEIFMFDEPTAGMSVDEVPVLLELIHQIKAMRDKTVLLVEHKMDVIGALADRIIVLHQGCLMADGDPAEVMALPLVQQAYLGSTGVRHE
ncbi:ABC transporter ATP-binding protein [Duganella qianjiadongensis]|uniref:ATP-binding cassette domain-containing protein n=1 Tax=Duganella qianjiadongensis TaxID=2692176 RepID=A0ABW9VPS1_9BURK|nr:ABC transporter ATP-binding protein [Duganella qianjiadongensis]MYM40434.1 ATP-binding cassette domain-containing protein [Duganella qianjiadongensis]